MLPPADKEKLSWQVPPKGVVLWASIPLHQIQVEKNKVNQPITEQKPHVVTILPSELWEKEKLTVKSGSITVGPPKTKVEPKTETEGKTGPIRATLETKPDKPGQFVIEMTNTSDKTVRFLDVREGCGLCGDFYEVTIVKDGKTLSSDGVCGYSSLDPPKIVELAPKQTYRRDIIPEGYFAKTIKAPYELTVTYRLSDDIKTGRKERQWKYQSPSTDGVDLDLTFQATKTMSGEKEKQ